MIALSYGITYIWGTVGIILICKYLPRWWGVDAKAAAKKYEEEFGVNDVEGAGLTGFRPFGLRAYRLENAARPARASRSSARPIRNTASSMSCAATSRSAPIRPRAAERRRHRARRRDRSPDRQDGPDRPGSRRPEGAQHPARPGRDPRHQQGGRRRGRSSRSAISRSPASCRSCKFERGGVPIPAGLKTKLQRMDILRSSA